MASNVPPRVLLTWAATARGANFGGYRIYRRPARAAARPWARIGEISVPAGYTAATVEAQHNAWMDYAPGWARAGGAYEDGWDYSVTVVDAVTGLESPIADATVTRVQVATGGAVWLVCNAAPWLNTPLAKANKIDGDDLADVQTYQVAGRPRAVVRTRDELPARQWQVKWRHFGFAGEEPARPARAAAASHRQVTLLTSRGDRIEGVLSPPSLGQNPDPLVEADATLVETDLDPAVADYNLPAGAVLDGTNDHALTASVAALNPGAGAFTLLICGRFADAVDTLLSKGNPGTSDGYRLLTDGAAGVGFHTDGTSAATLTSTSSSWFDATRVLGATSTGTAQTIFRDGVQVAAGASAHGAITNAVAFVAGANNGGAANFAAINPLHAWAYYPRALTAAEHLAAARYLLGHPGVRMPAGAAVFYDLRDDRCWNGFTTTLTDLGGSGRIATLTNGPITRGIPWPLADLDQWA